MPHSSWKSDLIRQIAAFFLQICYCAAMADRSPRFRAGELSCRDDSNRSACLGTQSLLLACSVGSILQAYTSNCMYSIAVSSCKTTELDQCRETSSNAACHQAEQHGSFNVGQNTTQCPQPAAMAYANSTQATTWSGKV